MSVVVRVVDTKADLKRFVKIPFDIYADCELWVPPLIRDELRRFDSWKNPSYEHAETRLFIAYKNEEPVGRVAAILSHAANKMHQTRNLRFGWFDCIDDYDVAQALLNAVEDWGRELGMVTVTGPMGFSDLEPKGMLIEGFGHLPTITTYYNHPYYPQFMERYGFEKDVDYVEFRSVCPGGDVGVPEKLLRLGQRIKERSGLRVVDFKSRRDVLKRAPEGFKLLDETYKDVYGWVPLTGKQISYYIKKYRSYADKDLVQMVVNEKDQAVGFMIAMPSLAMGFRKAGGKRFPFGIFHLWKALRNYEVLDFFLAGVAGKYRGYGVDVLMTIEVVSAAIKKGVRFAESNPELETDHKVHAQWKYFDPTQHKRRRIFTKPINTQ